jgi:serine/threonine protein kinase
LVADDNLSRDQLRTIDSSCDAFERQWQQGASPRIEDQLSTAVELVRPLLLAELLRTELEWRCRRGQQPAAADYRDRFPSCASQIDAWLSEAQAAARAIAALAAADTGVTPQPTHVGPAAPPPPTLDDPPPSRTMLGEYELLEPLGAGGMGEVWKARHRKLGKLVAIKLLPAHKDKDHAQQATARFLREMKAVGQLDHPNVVEAYDAGEQDGRVYLVMKLVEGVDLSRHLKQSGPMTVTEACDSARQVAQGLDYLHRQGLVHRDIKPSNLIRTPDGTVKILDLGLARWHDNSCDDLTETGRPMGTPEYMAPEQITSAAEVDIRADLYSLGATLFHWLTGRAPFAHHTGLFQKCDAHKNEPPPDLCSLRPDVPAELGALVNQLLAKKPSDRPQTPAEVAERLAAFVDIPTIPTVIPPPVPKPRHRRWAGLAAGIGVSLLLGVPVWLLSRDTQDRPPTAGAAVTEPDAIPNRVALRVVRFDVQHFANVDGKFDQPKGLLSKTSFGARLNDSVTLEAELSRPTYAYLIAFRPDGVDEVCFPERDDEAPPLTDRPRYPSVSRGVNYGLNDGTGMYVFALVVSDKALPPYREWRKQRGTSPWKRETVPAGVIWRDDGQEIRALTVDNPDGQRAQGKEIAGKTAVAALSKWLRSVPGIEIVTATGLAVAGAGQP